MRFRNLLWLGLALLSGLMVVNARPKEKSAKGWTEPFSNWSHAQIDQLLKDSPWAKSQAITNAPGMTQAGQGGENDHYYLFTARFFSSLPVREGYVRSYQILNNYDSMDPAQKQQFDAKFKRALDLDVSNRVIVALEFSTNDPAASRNVVNYLHTATKDTFKQSAYLISQRLGRVDLAEYFPPSNDGTGAKFIFPRTMKGEPVVAPGDKDVKIDIYMPPVNQRILLGFDVGQLNYDGKLTF